MNNSATAANAKQMIHMLVRNNCVTRSLAIPMSISVFFIICIFVPLKGQVAPGSSVAWGVFLRRATGIASIPVSWCSCASACSCSHELLPPCAHLLITERKVALDLLLAHAHPPPHARPSPSLGTLDQAAFQRFLMSVPDLAVWLGGARSMGEEGARFPGAGAPGFSLWPLRGRGWRMRQVTPEGVWSGRKSSKFKWQSSNRRTSRH
ncbi:MAG: hypothetical protein GIKADHBN_02353 [Phycisphaerales bacterium]|nr:hypothetical protein [Phycisphaerales bacterium]